MHKNMKIEINDTQPLSEVVRELESSGYSMHWSFKSSQVSSIETLENGYFYHSVSKWGKLTTLAELKGM